MVTQQLQERQMSRVAKDLPSPLDRAAATSVAFSEGKGIASSSMNEPSKGVDIEVQFEGTDM